MKTNEELAWNSGFGSITGTLYASVGDTELDRFATLVEQRLIAKLIEGVGEPVCKVGSHWNSGGGFDVYSFKGQPDVGSALCTLEQLAAAVLAERNKALDEASHACRSNHERVKNYTGTLRAHDEDLAAFIEAMKGAAT